MYNKHIMNEKYIEKLEFNLIKNMLKTYSKTFLGQKKIDLLLPSNNKNQVSKSMLQTSELIKLAFEKGSIPIYEFEDLQNDFKILESDQILSTKSILNLNKILKNSENLVNYIEDSELSIANIFNNLYTNKKISTHISDSIISENEISDEASQNLSKLRKSIKNTELKLKNTLNNLIYSSDFSKYCMEQIITIRNSRFVIPIKSEYKSQVKGFVHDTSSTGSTLYIEPLSVFELNNELNNLRQLEQIEIQKILSDITNLLFEIRLQLQNNLNIISELDFINARARFSMKNNYVEPIFSDSINLINATHPLLNKETAVPISINIGKNFNTLIITGPNTGGKTISLKTVGLISVMAQSGLFIPAAENSRVKIFDNIFADIGDEQNILESLSTFSSHIKNIVNFIENLTDNSLILLDELCSGTDPLEGANLAISILEYFNKKNTFTIATSHYQELKQYAITNKNFENASVEFDLKNLKPTYKLLIGVPGKSNAFNISKRLGIPEEILSRGHSLLTKPEIDLETLMKNMYDQNIEIEKNKVEIEKNLKQVSELRKKLEISYNEKLKNEEIKLSKIKQEAKQILIDAKNQANKLIATLSKLNQNEIKKAHKLSQNFSDSIDELSENSIDYSSLLSLNNKIAKAPTKSHVKKQVSSVKNINTEINLIGETVDSATSMLEQFLDGCFRVNLKEIKIIHGKGSGALRTGIQNYLKTSKYVESFENGKYGDGDFGVTIAKLKSK